MSNTIEKPGTLTVISTAFLQASNIPSKYTCQGENINPPLTVTGIPKECKTLALIVEDPDATHGTFDHWIVWNIAPTGQINENTNPGVAGNNGAGQPKYTGPCPPSGSHRYYFRVFALDTNLTLAQGSSKDALTKEMKHHILAKGELMGWYQKS